MLTHVVIRQLHFLSAMRIRIGEMYFLLSFPWIRKYTSKMNCFFKNYICRSILTIQKYLFFLEHLKKKFDTILSCSVVVARNYSDDNRPSKQGLGPL